MDPGRLAIGMGLLGLVMAGLNLLVARLQAPISGSSIRRSSISLDHGADPVRVPLCAGPAGARVGQGEG
jgi:hypothetical protein